MYKSFFKRVLDIALSGVAIIVFSPLLVYIAYLVKTRLGSPVLFTQDRPGKDCKVFKLYKFRSMLDSKDDYGNLLSDDERLTDFGRWLRSTSLDELPELYNILKGDMSIIGPRPLLVEYLPYYTKEEMHRHDVRPGLSGLAQVNGRNNLTWEELFEWDLKYVNNITFLGDIKIVFLTFYKVLKKSDILVGSQNKVGRLDYERSSKN